MVRKGLEKSLKIEKLWEILEKSLNFPQKSLNIFESSLNRINLWKKVFCTKGRLKAQQYTSSCNWWSWKYVFLWFQCSRHSSLFIIWSTLGTVPSLGKVLQYANSPPPTNLKGLYSSCHAMSIFREKMSLKSPWWFPQKFCMNHVDT